MNKTLAWIWPLYALTVALAFGSGLLVGDRNGERRAYDAVRDQKIKLEVASYLNSDMPTLFRDPDTGCEYLLFKASISPRLFEGKPVCECTPHFHPVTGQPSCKMWEEEEAENSEFFSRKGFVYK